MYRSDDIIKTIKAFKKINIMDLYSKTTASLTEDLFWNHDGIHGLSHTKHVIFYALVIGVLENVEISDFEILARASKLHDIGRIHDGFCQIHGYLSWRKAYRNNLLQDIESNQRETVRYMVENHCISDQLAYKELEEYQIKEKKRAHKLFEILKDADALDRFRLGDFDSQFLRRSVSNTLISLAQSIQHDSDIFYRTLFELKE